MKRIAIVGIICLYAIRLFPQNARQDCCSSFHFFADATIQFVRDSLIHYRYNPSNETWEESYFNTYSYDNNLKIKEHLIYVSDPEDLLRKRLNRYEYEYKREELVMTRVGYSWDEDGNPSVIFIICTIKIPVGLNWLIWSEKKCGSWTR